eukprot:166633-Rhodomonas_salina.1
MTSNGSPISFTMVQSAVKLAQRHLEEIPGDYKEPITLTLHVDTTEVEDGMDEDPVALQAHIAKKEKVLVVLQKQSGTEPTQGQSAGQGCFGGRGGRGCTQLGRGGLRGGGRGGRGGGTGGGGNGSDYPFQNSGRACTICCKTHPGSPQEDECFHRYIDAEMAKLKALEEKKRAATERAKERQEQRQYQRTQYVVNKTDDTLNGAAVDLASPIDIQNDEDQVQLTCAPNVFLEGIIPGATEVPAAECAFPTIDIYGRPVVLCTKGKGILHKKATSKVIDLGGLLHSGCKAFALHYGKNLEDLTAESSWIQASNQYSALLELATEIEPVRESKVPEDMERVEKITKQIMQLLHELWGHPSNTKMESIICYYKGKGFPPGFLAELKHFRCKVCAICKGARVYKHTKRVQEKMEKNKKARTSKNWEQ